MFIAQLTYKKITARQNKKINASNSTHSKVFWFIQFKLKSFNIDIFSIHRKFREHQIRRFMPFENFESTKSEELYPSKISKASNRKNYTIRKIREHQIRRIISFENFESIKSEELYPSKISKAKTQQIYTLRKFRNHHLACIGWFYK